MATDDDDRGAADTGDDPRSGDGQPGADDAPSQTGADDAPSEAGADDAPSEVGVDDGWAQPAAGADARIEVDPDDDGWGQAAERERASRNAASEQPSADEPAAEAGADEPDASTASTDEPDASTAGADEPDASTAGADEPDASNAGAEPEAPPVAAATWPAPPSEWPTVRRIEVASDAGDDQTAAPTEDAEPEPSTDWGDDPTPPPMLADVDEHRAPPGHVRSSGGGGRRRLVLVGAAVLALLVGAGGLLSWLNARHYYLACGADRITAERGSFWPWGRDSLAGERYRAIPIPPDAHCSDRSFDDLDALEEAFLDALLERAATLLTSGDASAVAEAEAELSQALLLTRSANRSERREQVERLQGDVEYWQAAAEVQAAMTALADAAERFDDAATRRPRHNSDAAAWAKHARRMEAEIRKGPLATRKDAPPSADGKPHFAGTGDDPATASPAPPTPATPTSPGTDAATGPDADAGAGAPLPAADAGPPPADARLPRGGVLL